MNPVAALFRSRKFLLLILDTLISTALFFVGEYATPDSAKMINFLIAAYQPAFVAIIIAISVEDAAAIRAGTHITCCKPPC